MKIERGAKTKQKRKPILFFTQFIGLVRRFLGKTGGRTQRREENNNEATFLRCRSQRAEGLGRPERPPVHLHAVLGQ